MQSVAQLAAAAPRRLLVCAALLTVALAVFGVPVAKNLSAGGFADPASESAQAAAAMTGQLSQGDVPMLVTVTTPDGVDSPAARAVGTDIVNVLVSTPHVVNATSPWMVPPPAAADLVSKDRTVGLITAGIIGDEIMSISFASLIAADVAFMRLFGLGLTLAVLVDATLVRRVLIPAFMHLAGRWNWCAPAPLLRLYGQLGLGDGSSNPVPRR